MKKGIFFIMLTCLTMMMYGSVSDTLTYLYKKLHVLQVEQKNTVREVKNIHSMLDSLSKQDQVMYDAFLQKLTQKELTIDQVQNNISAVQQTIKKQHAIFIWLFFLFFIILLLAIIYMFRLQRKLIQLTKKNNEEHDLLRQQVQNTQQWTETKYQELIKELSRQKETTDNMLQNWKEQWNQSLQQLSATTNEKMEEMQQNWTKVFQELQHQVNSWSNELQNTSQHLREMEKQVTEKLTQQTSTLHDVQQAIAEYHTWQKKWEEELLQCKKLLKEKEQNNEK